MKLVPCRVLSGFLFPSNRVGALFSSSGGDPELSPCQKEKKQIKTEHHDMEIRENLPILFATVRAALSDISNRPCMCSTALSSASALLFPASDPSTCLFLFV